MITLTTKMDMLEGHVHFAMKDVSTMQQDVKRFRETVEGEVKSYNDGNVQKFSQLRLNIK